jgi:hypothetical protein
MLGIENAYLDAFFDMCLKGEKEKLLEGPSEDYPAVEFWPSLRTESFVALSFRSGTHTVHVYQKPP